MAEEDPSRPQWPSNPAYGWTSGVDRLTGLPNGNALIAKSKAGALALPLVAAVVAGACTTQLNVDYAPGPVRTVVDAPDAGACCDACAHNATTCSFAVFFEGSCYFKLMVDASTPVWSAGRVAVWPAGAGPIPNPPAPTGDGNIEAHGPYQHGGGFPAVNGYPADGAFTPNVPPSFNAGPFTVYGGRVPGIFFSEFGASGWSSFESVAPTLPPANWAMHGGAPANPEATCKAGFTGICPGSNPLVR